jgi:hypothetical protein
MRSEAEKWIQQCGGVVLDEQLAEVLDEDVEFVRGFGLGRGQPCLDGAVLFLAKDALALIDELENVEDEHELEEDDGAEGDSDAAEDDSAEEDDEEVDDA